jgi:tetratricopeptide (TPR) repeat protein
MAVIHESKERMVVPNWRDFDRTIQFGELNPNAIYDRPININIDRAINDWRNIKNLGSATDLLNSAYVASMLNSKDLLEAIELIKQNQSQSSSGMMELVDRITSGNSQKPSYLDVQNRNIRAISDFYFYINDNEFHNKINQLKKKSKEYLDNAIIWVELARLYSIKGQTEKAEQAIITALHLAPDNRFVLRSATRFFIHSQSVDKALFYLRKGKSISKDPWLISAHIATSSCAGRFSPFIKAGKGVIDSDNFSNFDLTELSSSIGTLEFKDGSIKKAKKFFRKSMLAPNDNSLAQLEWITNHDPRFEIDPRSFEQVKNPFEAYALDLFKNGQWKKAYNNTMNWFLDAPYSKRPIMLGSYITSSLLNDKAASIALCEVGLQANPTDPTILNNMVYSLVTSGKLDKIDPYLSRIEQLDIKALPIGNQVSLQATIGLVALKTKQKNEGLRLYEKAIEIAKKVNNSRLKNLAILNLTKELIFQNMPEKDYYKNLVLDMKIDDSEPDLVHIKKEVVEKIKKDRS